MIYEIYLNIKGFTNRLKKDSVSAFSAQAAFFMILSIVPFLSLLLTLIQFLPISEKIVTSVTSDILPSAFSPMITTIIDEVFSKSNGAVISVSAILAVWSAARGVLSIIRGLNSVYHLEEKRNYFVLRFVSAIYTVLFVTAIVLTLLLLVFSNSIYKFFLKQAPVIAGLLAIFIDYKILLTAGLLVIFFLFVYKLVPNEKFQFINLLPGAIISSLSWILFSYAFSLYIDNFSNFSYTYGSLSTIAILMLWVYICMYILFIGAEINIYFKLYFEMLGNCFKKHKK